MKGETIFRFFSVRPAAPAKHAAGTRLLLDPYSITDKPSEFFTALEVAAADRSPREKLLAAARNFMSAENFVDRLSDLGPRMQELVTWFYEKRREAAAGMFASDEFKIFTGESSGEQMPTDIATLYTNVVDSIVALAIAGKSGKRKSEELVVLVKLLFFRYGAIEKPAAEESLGSFVSKHVLALPAFLDDVLYQPKETRAPKTTTDPKAGAAGDIGTLERAHEELSRLLRTAVFTRTTTNLSPTGIDPETGASPPQLTGLSAETRFPGTMIDRLSTETKSLFPALQLDPLNTDPFYLLTVIEDEMKKAAAAEPEEITGVVRIGGALVDLGKLRAMYTTGPVTTYGGTLQAQLNACTFSAGLGDLLLVRQTLKGYRLGEIAHVENVLQGEKRERNHRRLNRVTDEFFTEEEREETRERDLETTERNELQSEMSRTAVTELGIDVGVQVSGSFGPSMSFDSQVDSSFSSTVEESQRKATTFSRELSEKSSEKIRERVKKERRKISLEEIEEVNVHAFENKSEAHIRGVYRWMDKLYDAQVFSYGQRMIFDFVLPEPAAFFLFALTDSPPDELNIPKPQPPKAGKKGLQPGDLTRTNYQKYIRQYSVTGAPEPPPQFVTVSFFEKQEGNSKNNYARAAKLTIPDNYAAYSAAIGSDLVHPGDDPGKDYDANIQVGGQSADLTARGWDFRVFTPRREKELALAIHYRRIYNFSIAIDVFCELTATGFAAWQHKMYDAIIEAYQLRLAEFEEKMATATLQRGNTGVLGTTPAANQNIAREELRKLAIMLLTNNAAPGLNSFKNQEEPVIDPAKVCANGAVIRFFENAFEWNNMAYVMYPYFWGRKARWTSAIQLSGNDPEFTAFLKAGAARVQLAVRPGFEKAVVHFIQFGEIWEGNDPPVVEDDTYVPIIQEIAENLGRLEDGAPYPEDSKPWEVSLPTSLVYLQEDVPVFEDPLAQ